MFLSQYGKVMVSHFLKVSLILQGFFLFVYPIIIHCDLFAVVAYQLAQIQHPQPVKSTVDYSSILSPSSETDGKLGSSFFSKISYASGADWDLPLF